MLKKLNPNKYHVYFLQCLFVFLFAAGVLRATTTETNAQTSAYSDNVKQDYMNMLSRGEKKDCPSYMSKQVTCFKYTFCEAKSMGDSLIVYDGTSNQRMMYFTRSDVISDVGDQYIGKISDFCIGK